MEIAVLTVRNVGGQAVMRSVNRHIEKFGCQWVGRHPDFYDGVDTKNVRAEEMFAGLESELAGVTKKLEALDEEIAQWTDDARLKDFADKVANRLGLNLGEVFGLFISVQSEALERLKAKRTELMAEAINVGVKKEHAERYLSDVQRDFPRMVVYV
ncbi:MAG TPA: hypothetical protein VJH05_00750 [Candidatus Paceibacterota bacterium]